MRALFFVFVLVFVSSCVQVDSVKETITEGFDKVTEKTKEFVSTVSEVITGEEQSRELDSGLQNVVLSYDIQTQNSFNREQNQDIANSGKLYEEKPINPKYPIDEVATSYTKLLAKMLAIQNTSGVDYLSFYTKEQQELLNTYQKKLMSAVTTQRQDENELYFRKIMQLNLIPFIKQYGKNLLTNEDEYKLSYQLLTEKEIDQISVKFLEKLLSKEDAYKIVNGLLSEQEEDKLAEKLATRVFPKETANRLVQNAVGQQEAHKEHIQELVDLNINPLELLQTNLYQDIQLLQTYSKQNSTIISTYNELIKTVKVRLSEHLSKQKNVFLADAMANFSESNKLYYAGKFKEALSYAEQHYQLLKKAMGSNNEYTLTSLNYLGMIHHLVGNLDKAESLFKDVYSKRKKLLGSKDANTITTLSNLATVYQTQGNLEKALSLHEEAYELHKEVLGKSHPDTLLNLHNIASLYQILGRLDVALPLNQEVYQTRKTTLSDRHLDTLASLNNLVGIYSKKGDIAELEAEKSKIKQAYKNSLELFGKEHPDTLMRQNNLGVVYYQVGQFNKALSEIQKAYQLRKKMLGEHHLTTLNSLNNLASVQAALSHLDEAIDLHKITYAQREQILGEEHPDTLQSLNNLATTYMQAGNLQKSVYIFQKLLKNVENLRQGNFSPENRQTLFKQYIPSYVSYALAQIQANQIDNAFHTVELTKARTLLESIALKLAIENTNLSAKEHKQLNSFHKKITTLDYRIVQTSNAEQQITLRTEKNKLTQQSIVFQNKLKQRYPKFAQLADPKILTAQQGQKLIPKDTLFINYLEHNNRILVFTLDNMGNLHGYDLDESSYLDNYLTLVKDINKSPYKIALDSELLSAQLLTPIQQQLERYPNWIISPSGKLAQIPFETLFLNDEMVIKNHQISYVQSLSTYALLKQREKDLTKQRNRKALLAFGAPYYQDPNKPTIKCKTRSPTNTTTEKLLLADASVYRNALQRLGTWCTLKGTETELDELKRLFSTQKPIIYRHKNASEPKLIQLNQQKQLKNYKYLHFATHGYLDNQTPALSSIVLSQVNTTDKYDGYITASEWIGYDLRSDLMVLSACDTAAGGSMSGEGIMGLPYALYVAGNKNTLMTLWSINDESSAEFIKRFYQKVLEGQTHIQALNTTKLEFIQHPKYSHPALWAAFVLYGV